MSIEEKYLWGLSDVAKYLGVTLSYLTQIRKTHPERLPRPIPHPIGARDKYLKTEVIAFYSNQPSVTDSLQ